MFRFKSLKHNFNVAFNEDIVYKDQLMHLTEKFDDLLSLTNDVVIHTFLRIIYKTNFFLYFQYYIEHKTLMNLFSNQSNEQKNHSLLLKEKSILNEDQKFLNSRSSSIKMWWYFSLKIIIKTN